MGIYGAMITAVSGLRSQSYALENISGNIANSRTTGFKRVDTSFMDLVPDLPLGREISGSVIARSQGTNTIQGDLTTTNVGTNVAINGEGFFTVAERTDFTGGNPVFSGSNLYTRRGDFELDRNGYLVNGAGYYLKGLSIDPTTGTQTGAGAGVIRLNRDQLPPRPTTKIEYRANLPATPRTTFSDRNPTIPGSELMDPTAFTTDPLATGTVLNTGTDLSTFVDRSIPGARLQVYSQDGTPADFELNWAKTSNAPDSWAAFVRVDNNPPAGGIGWQRIGGNFTFDAAGNLTPPGLGDFVIPAMTVQGVPIGAVNFVSNGAIKQFYDPQRAVQASTVSQDGYTAGILNDVEFDSEGRLIGNYSNGSKLPLAQVQLAQFNADNALKRRDGGVFEETLESGAPLVGQYGANMVRGALENSNTDISDEFTKMIVTQQAYSANTRVISTSSDMLRDVINIIR
jgi:flagellar hook protein FlgE